MNPHYERPTLIVAAVLPALFLVAFFVLGAAVDWPNSLNGSAEDYLPLVAENADAVRVGYFFYFAASALWGLLAVLAAIWLGASRRPGLAMAAVLGVFAGLFKMLGIARWLEAMPLLAGNLGTEPGTTAVAYELLNDYAGVTLGEGIGVGLFTGLWFAAMALASGPSDDAEDTSLPLWLRGVFGLTALFSLAGFLQLFGIRVGEIGMITGNLQYFSIWFLAGVIAWRRYAPLARPTTARAL
jgi:hypothetical protein